MAQLMAVAISVIYSAVMTGAIMLILKKAMNIRVSPEAEALGLDIREHSGEGHPAFSGIDQ